MRRANGVGIVTRHSRACSTRSEHVCDCTPTFEAWLWSPGERKKIRRSFRTLPEAVAWRSHRGHSDNFPELVLRATDARLAYRDALVDLHAYAELHGLHVPPMLERSPA